MYSDRTVKKYSNFKSVALILVILTLVSVSYSFVSRGNKEDDHKKGEETFTFYSGEHNDKYIAVFSDGEMKSLSKNGELLSKNVMKGNEDLVYEKINSLSSKSWGEDKEDFVFHFNNREFREHMKHFGEDMKSLKPHILKELDSVNCNFDTTAFNKQMRELKINLASLKKMRINILKDLDNDLDIPDIQMDEKDFNIDMDGINKDLEKASEDIKKSSEQIKNLDIPELTERIKEEMKKAGADLKKSKKELRNLDQFLNNIRQEMIKDNLIKNREDKINLKIDDGDIYINGKKLPEGLAKKYKKIYMDKFGHNKHHSFQIDMNE